MKKFIETLSASVVALVGFIGLLFGLGQINDGKLVYDLFDNFFYLQENLQGKILNEKAVSAIAEKAILKSFRRIDTGFIRSFQIPPNRSYVPQDSDVPSRALDTESYGLTFFARRKQRICVSIARQFVLTRGKVEIEIDGENWRTYKDNESGTTPAEQVVLRWETDRQKEGFHQIKIKPDIAPLRKKDKKAHLDITASVLVMKAEWEEEATGSRCFETS